MNRDLDTPTDLLVVAAHPVELAPLEELLAERTSRLRLELCAVGVGAVAAAVGTATALSRCRPAAILLVGSVGAYPGRDVPQQGLVIAASTHWLAPEIVAGRAEIPTAVAATADFDPGLVAELQRALPLARRGRIATTHGITIDDELASQLADLGEEFENLEALAIAAAARQFEVPAAALLGITNRVGSSGRAQWRAQHRRVAGEVARALVQWLEAAETLRGRE